MSQRTCRCCGAGYAHPAPASRATKRHCERCVDLPEAVRAVLEQHQLELVRLRQELDRLTSGESGESGESAGGD